MQYRLARRVAPQAHHAAFRSIEQRGLGLVDDYYSSRVFAASHEFTRGAAAPVSESANDDVVSQAGLANAHAYVLDDSLGDELVGRAEEYGPDDQSDRGHDERIDES